MRPTLVLDLDGTLVDSLPDLHASLNRLLVGHSLAPLARHDVARLIGDGAAALVRRGMQARGRVAEPADIDAFLADYGAHAAEATRAFPDVQTTLATLQADGWRLAVCTNKPGEPARALLRALGLLHYFDAVGAGDTFSSRKPDPAHLLATLAQAGGEPSACIMVGDHRNDVEAAAGAGVPAIFAAWGYGTDEMATGAAATAQRVADLPGIANRLLTPSS